MGGIFASVGKGRQRYGSTHVGKLAEQSKALVLIDVIDIGIRRRADYPAVNNCRHPLTHIRT